MDTSLTKGSIGLSIWKISWPMTVIMLCNFMLGMVDIYAAGRLGSEVQASVGFSMQIYFLLMIAANAMGVGSLSLLSRAAGAGDRMRTLEIARQSVFSSLILSILLGLLLFVFSREIATLAGLPTQIRGLSASLLQIYAIAMALNYLIIVSNAIFRARGDVRRSMFVMLSMNMINIALIFPLVFGFGSFKGYGPQGLALSLSISTLWGASVCLYFFLGKDWAGFYKSPINLSRSDLINIFSIGWPSALMQIAWHSGTIALMNIIASIEGGVMGLAAITNGLRIEAVIYLPAYALNMAAAVLIGQNLGAGNHERATKTGWRIAFYGMGIVSLMSLIILLTAPSIVLLISSDSEVQKETIRYLLFNMPVEPFMALGAALAGAMQGAGDTRGVMKIIVFCMWAVRIPLAWVLAVQMQWGITGIWTSMITSMILQGTLMAWRFRQGSWQIITHTGK